MKPNEMTRTSARRSSDAAAALPAMFASAALLIGVTGAVTAQGHDGLSLTLGIAGAAFLWATGFGRRGGTGEADAGESGMISHLTRRYDSAPVGVLAGLVLGLCLIGLLAAEVAAVASAVAWLASPIVGTPMLVTVAVLLMATLALETARANWGKPRVNGLAAITLVALVIALLAALSAVSGGDGLGVAVSSPTLATIVGLEQGLLEKHLVDPSTYKPFGSPYLRVDVLNTLALTATLGLGLATLATARLNRAASSGRQKARGLVLLAALLVLVPAVAAGGRRTLLAAFTDDEVAAQLGEMNLSRLLIDVPDDRHWVVGGRLI